MAKQEVGLKIDVDVQSVGNMKQQLRAATQDLIAMNEKFGSSSKEATEAARRVARLKDAIGDAKALADTFNPDKKFVALGGAVQGAVAGFSALQGAVGLFGDKSKEVEEVLLKVQSAMALQQGISGVAGAIDSFKILAGDIKGKVVTAFNALRGAIGATGIGLLVVGLGLLTANFDKVKAAVMRLIPGLSTIADFIGGLVTKITDFVGITSEAERNLEKFTKANKKANESIDAQIKLLEAQGGKEDQVYRLKKQRAENELNTLREALKTKGKLTDEELKQFKDLKLQQQLLDIEESNRKKKLADEEAKRIKEASDKANEKLKKDKEDKKKKDEEEKKRLEELQKNTENNLKENAKRTKELQDQLRLARITDEKEKAKAENQIRLQNELDAETERFKKGEVRLEQYLINLALIKQRYAEEDKAKQTLDEQENIKKQSDKLLKDSENETIAFDERLAKIQEREGLVNQIKFATEEERTAFEKQNADARVRIAESESNARMMLARAVGDTLSALSDVVGRETAAGKALAIAQATINTFLGITEVWKAKAVLPEPFNTATKVAATITTAAGGFAAVKRIAQTSVPGAGGGGGGGGITTTAPVTPALAPQVVATQVNTAAVNQMGNRAARAYVLNSDIQNDNQRNAYIDRSASIG